MIEVLVKDEGILPFLRRATAGMRDATPLMRAWAGTLESETEKNFAAQGRPAWLGLAPSTIKARTRKRTWPGQILQVSAGGLAASVVTDYGRDFARVGSNKPYAAIHQLGGKAGRGRKVKIPARPYLPFIGTEVQPVARAALISDATAYLRSLVSP